MDRTGLNSSDGQRVVAIIQARMGSSRLPGKVLTPILDQPMLAVVVRRMTAARSVDQIVIATTRLPEDDAVARLADELGIACVRGAADDVLDRFYETANSHHADVVVRLTGDNPILDGTFVDIVVDAFRSQTPPYDYVDSARSKTFPLGLSVEVFSATALAAAWREATDALWREHVTPFIYLHPERFRVRELVSPVNYGHYRWTVDWAEDLDLIRRIYAHFGHDRFSWHEALDVVNQHPSWAYVNRNIKQRDVS